MAKQFLSTMVDEQDIAELQRIANEERLTRSDIVRRAIAFYLSSCPKNKTTADQYTEKKIELQAA
jgi:hypothetical protein